MVNANGNLVEAGEERRLLAAANPTLQRIIIAALESGMRLGELRALQWRDVSLPRRELRVRAENSKTDTSRDVIINDRLAGVLEMVRTDPTGKEYRPFDFVFGDVARKLGSIKKTWTTCVLKAHGHTPKWDNGGKLAPESRVVLRSIDLHFHDLRHEAGSRLIERGVPLHEVQAQLGHADAKQTSTYVNATLPGRHTSMRRADGVRESVTSSLQENPPQSIAVACNDNSSKAPKSLVN